MGREVGEQPGNFPYLTTLGCGDLGPTVLMVRFFSFMGAIVGEVYLAILVASLAGIRISNRHK